MGIQIIGYTDDEAYLCKTCKTYISLCSHMQEPMIQSNIGKCVKLSICKNIHEYDGYSLQYFRTNTISYIQFPASDNHNKTICSIVHCNVCNNFLGWNTPKENFLILQKTLS